MDANKNAGELVAECPFHFLVAKQSPTDSSTRREVSLYVNLREGSWSCVRCKAGGDATQFGYLMDAIATRGGHPLGDAWQSAMEDVMYEVEQRRQAEDEAGTEGNG